jgi:hypothetical protein
MDANGDIVNRAMQALQARISSERQRSADMGLFDTATGLPTMAGLGQAARAYAGGMSDGGVGSMMGAIRAYHGSPHSFDRFDLGKIGTGEGAQAYGHGLYFAGNEGVARGYRDALSKPANPAFRTADGTVEPLNSTAAALYGKHNGDADAAMQEFMAFISGKPEYAAARLRPEETLRGLAGIKASPVVQPPAGHMYEVSLNTEPSRLLDWDKPLAGQGPDIQAAAQRAAQERLASIPAPQSATQASIVAPLRTLPTARDIAEGRFGNYTGDEAYTAAGGYKLGPNAAAASERLRSAGIPGIQYLDQGSRAAGAGSHNYVMFDPKLIEILRKYVAPPVAVGAASAPFGFGPDQ